MKNKDKQIDKLFQKSLGNYEETPSASVWDSIDIQLPKNNSRIIYWVAASIAVFLITSTIGWNFILERTNAFTYETNEVSVKANYPQKEFILLPILIHTKSIVYIEREATVKIDDNFMNVKPKVTDYPSIRSSNELKPVSDYYTLNTYISIPGSIDLINSENEPLTIIYKKGNPKYPLLAKAVNFIKEVGEGERQLINFEKLSIGLLARRETNNNSNN